jgi:mono/diheme cytochrome c family protein
MTKVLTVVACVAALLWSACRASDPTGIESMAAQQAKLKLTIGGKDRQNPTPDNPESVNFGRDHFQHHCQICHGLDGHNTGVPFAETMSPPVADLGSEFVQKYTDGQLKWIIENGIRFTGMPAWKGILTDEEMWHIVRYLRNLPAKGSLPPPAVYLEGGERHVEAKPGVSRPHTHPKDTKAHKH